MKCPKCKRKAKASATRFIEYSHTQRRIRTCECGFKFVTHEIIEPDKQDLGKTSKEVTLKQNSCGAKIPHYQVLWDHQSSPSLVSQHRIELENEVSKM